MNEMIKKFNDKLPGYAIGGLSGGESKDEFWRIVHLCTKYLPKNKPRYCMGVGYPLDLIVCISLGVDMFDCVYPCRTARFGTALTTKYGELQLKKNKFKFDTNVIDENCNCMTCKNGNGYTRAYLHQIVGNKNSNSPQLITTHNITYLCNLMNNARNAIMNNKFESFVKQFMSQMFKNGVETYPKWAMDAFNAVGIKW